MMNVFVIAPTPMMQTGLHTMLTTPDIRVVGASAGPDIRVHGEHTPAVDVVVLADDTQLDEVGRFFTNTEIALVVLTNNDERILSRLRALGLRGWAIVPLDASASQLQAAVAATAQGLVAFPAQLAGSLDEKRLAPVAALNLDIADEPLTPREREVLELVGQGLSNKLIARRLQISDHTVKFHVSSISTKLGASSRTDAVRLGLRRGLITL